MKINYLKINEFGKLKNKEIKLENNINLIYGKNESGKTTLLKFISSMFYGISKNKNGQVICDFDKYKPWKGEDFSGKIKYELDNKEEYEIYREFSKKNPKIYNSNLEDISKEFSIDKTKGNRFFYEQTKIDEELFLATNVVEQDKTVLNPNSQNMLTQKIANILSSGEDSVSYKKVMANLSKKLLEEVGTERSTDRPLNRVLYEMQRLKGLKEEMENYSNTQEELKDRKKLVSDEIVNLQNEIELLNELKVIKQDEEKKNEELEFNTKIASDYKDKIHNLEDKTHNKGERQEDKKSKMDIVNIFLITIFALLNITINFININNIFKNIVIYSTLIYLLIYFIKYLKNKSDKNKIIKNNNLEKIKIEKEIEILEENKINKEKEMLKIKEEIKNKNSINLNYIENKYNNIINKEEINDLFNKNLMQINNEWDYLNNTYNNKKIELNTILIEEKNNNEKLEKKIECEEELENYYEEEARLRKLEKSINLVKETLEEAYNEMKNEVTPKFTKDLSLLIEKISSSKYKKASFDADSGLVVEKEDGEYVSCNNLSLGTIDQLYLSLRLSAMSEISEEKMPIILDETFAYYDNERLRNILKFMAENYTDNQIIIFTCSNREKEILEELKVEYNLVNL